MGNENFQFPKILFLKNLGSKIGSQKNQVKKIRSRYFGSKKLWVQKKWGPTKFWVQIISRCKKFGFTKFRQNWVSNSRDFPDMDKCHQDKCFLDKCHRDSWHLLKMVPGTYLKNLVKIGWVTAEIFLIWTNVTRTNIAWTNITISICLRCSQEHTFKVWIKFGR